MRRSFGSGGSGGSGPSAPGSSGFVVFRPGVASSGNFVATGAEVRAALAAGITTVYLDDTAAPCVADVGLPWDFGNIAGLAAWSNRQASNVLSVPEGAQLRNLRFVNDVVIACACTATPSLDFDYTVGPTLLMDFGGVIETTGAAAIAPIKVPNLRSFGLELNNGSGITRGAFEVIDLSATGTCVITTTNSFGGIGSAPVANDTVRGGVASSLSFQIDASFPRVRPTFVNLASAVVFDVDYTVGGPALLYEVDFSALATQSLLQADDADHAVVLSDGSTWTVQNAHTGLSSFGIVNGVGLVFQNTAGVSTMGAPGVSMRCLVQSKAPAWTLARPSEVWAHMFATDPGVIIAGGALLFGIALGQKPASTSYGANRGAAICIFRYAGGADFFGNAWMSGDNNLFQTGAEATAYNAAEDVQIISVKGPAVAGLYTGTWAAGWPGLGALSQRGNRDQTNNIPDVGYTSGSTTQLFIAFENNINGGAPQVTGTVANLRILQ